MEVGIDCVPRPTKTENLKKLCMWKLPEEQEGDWVVYTYVCNEDISKEDDFYGLFICLGHYPKKALARKYARKISLETDNNVCILQLGRWGELNSKPKVENSEIVCTDTDGKVVKLQDQVFEKEEKLYEKTRRKQIRRNQEQYFEEDPTHISYYRREWLKVIRANERLEKLEKEKKHLQEIYEKSSLNIRNHYNLYPEHDEKWIKELGELDYHKNTITYISENYKLLRNKVLSKID